MSDEEKLRELIYAIGEALTQYEGTMEAVDLYQAYGCNPRIEFRVGEAVAHE